MFTNTSAPAQGLHDPRFHHDACGVGFVAQIDGTQSHAIVEQGLTALTNLTHRGAVGADPLAGDGAGMLLQIPDSFFRAELAEQGIDLPGGSVRRLILSGEPAGSIPATKRMLEAQWGAKAADTAGMTEIGTIMIFECDHQPGGPHIIEDHFIEQVLDRTRYNVSAAARNLGTTRQTLRYRIEKHRIDIPD